MKARIYKPAKTAMQQSGQSNNHHWALELAPRSAPYIDPLMGWTGMTDTTQELHMTFTSKEEAIAYAELNAIEYKVEAPGARVIKPKSYAVNFAYNRVRDTTLMDQ